MKSSAGCSPPLPASTVDKTKPIAVVGMSCRFPGGSTDPGKLWDMLSEGRDGWTEGNSERFKMSSFHHPAKEFIGSFNSKGGYFLAENIAAFDAQFFNISPLEAKESYSSIDPQHRLQLELAFEALENAGITLDSVAGSDMGAYIATFTSDYERMSLRDPENTPMYHITGTGTTMLANRISYFFDLKGPSLVVDTACSGSLVALHLACQSIQSGESKSAIVGGANLILDPGVMTSLSNLGFLSDEGRCYTYDSRGSGYGRGEGVGCVVIKLLEDALTDGDPIRAVIRGSAVNSDGKTPGITMTSRKAQEELAQKAYAAAGLDPIDTGYVEAHGTGTKAGDPIEAHAIAEIFARSRSATTPLYLSSVKTNIGHLESASGIAGFIKSVLVLERGLIPPHLNFRESHQEIALDKWNIKIPVKLEPWPNNGLRRASINSFGYGGTNAHIVVDDGHNYLSSRGLEAPNPFISTQEPRPRLFVLSADSAVSLETTTRNLRTYLLGRSESDSDSFLDSLAHTLFSRRTHFPWRVAFTASTVPDLIQSLEDSIPVTKSTSRNRLIGFVFNGQGASWHAMGRELIEAYPSFKTSLQEANQYFTKFGADWDIIDELSRPMESSKVTSATLSQPLSTALQIALVRLLLSWNIEPAAVIGHSSGETAAAYASGSLTFEDALAVAYFRGYYVNSLSKTTPELEGAMLAVGLSEKETVPYISAVPLHLGRMSVACVNSVSSVTVSGDKAAVAKLQEMLESTNVFVRRLRVDAAYHSHHMDLIAESYSNSLLKIRPRNANKGIKFWSSLIGDQILGKEVDAKYWATNLTSQVRFSESLAKLCTSTRSSEEEQQTTSSSVEMLLEIGPHSALKGPMLTTIKNLPSDLTKIRYGSCLTRGTNACKSMLLVAGMLFMDGFPVDVASANFPDGGVQSTLVDLPSYSWDHSNTFWHESRLSSEYRLRKQPRHHILGVPALDNNPMEPRWRNFIRVAENPWVKGHMVQSKIVYPAAGFISMALEASQRLATEHHGSKKITGYSLRDINISKVLVVPDNAEGVETSLTLRPHTSSARNSSSIWNEFRIFSYLEDGGWSEHCRGLIRPCFYLESDEVEGEREIQEMQTLHSKLLSDALNHCQNPIDPLKLYEALEMMGLSYSDPFRGIKSMKTEGSQSVAIVRVPNTKKTMPGDFELPHIIHPATLDACFQTVFGSLSQNTTPLGTLVPTYIESVFIHEAMNAEYGAELRVLSTTSILDHRTCKSEITVTNTHDQDLPHVLLVSGIEFTALEQDSMDWSNKSMANVCYQVNWQIDTNFLDLQGMEDYFANKLPTEIAAPRLEALRVSSDNIIRSALTHLNDDTPMSDHHKLMYYWMKRYASAEPVSSPVLSQVSRERVELYGAMGMMLHRIGDKLPSILRGDVSPLPVMMDGNLLYEVYMTENLRRCNTQLAELVCLLSHKNPSMKILEIGAGTGGTTVLILEALLARQPGCSIGGFQEYDFTDISSGFFEKAETTMGAWSSLIRFKKLDIETDPTAQGFEEGSYDLIIASNVLHATRKIDETLANVRRLLRPGGKLALVELTRDTLHMSVIFGTLPGWWLGSEDGRTDSPILSVSQWNSALLRNGFTGVDLCLRDYLPKDEWTTSVLISSTIADAPLEDVEVEIINNSIEHHPVRIGACLKHLIKSRDVKVTTLEQAIVINNVCIFLSETTESVLSQCTKDYFEHVLRMLKNAAGVIWITRGSTMRCEFPEGGLTSGLTRTSRAENWGVKVITLDLDPVLPLSSLKIAHIINRLLVAHFSTTANTHSGEFEYAERNGLLFIPRLIVSENATNNVKSMTIGSDTVTLPFHGDSRRVHLQIETPGLLNTLRWIEQDIITESLGADEVDVEVRAAGVNFRDVMVCLGQLPGVHLDSGEYGGIITAVGKNMEHEFKVGDRVVAAGNIPYANVLRTRGLCAHRIPDDMSYETAASFPYIYATAYYSFVSVANLQRGESVLIHSAAGGVGQAAIMLAQHIGATIYATVGNERKKKFIMENYGVSEDHIFSSRSTSFAEGIKRMTSGKGVDVVLNSLSGEALRQTCQCMAPFGRFIEIGKKDILNNSRLDMSMFGKNVSYSGVDLIWIMQEEPEKFQNLLSKCLSLLLKGYVSVVKPISVFSISDIETAFRQIQAGKHMGKIVLNADPEVSVKILPKSSTLATLSSDSSYLVAGGLGGLGRGLCRWMVGLGAKNIIALSRSGLKSTESKALSTELRKKGVRFAVYTCNIADENKVEEVLELCKKEMPPIRGLIQCAMDLNDTTIQNMEYDDFQGAILPKVQGTVNLHKHLSGQLNFMILLSSVSGIVGNQGQGGYASGCTFQDAFARYASSTGLKVVAIDLGIIESAGYVSENSDRVRALGDLAPLKLQEFLATMSYAIIGDSSKADLSQLVIGLGYSGRGGSAVNISMHRDLRFSHLKAVQVENMYETLQDGSISWSKQLAGADTLDDAHKIVYRAISEILSKITTIPLDGIDGSKSISQHGADSLSAVELRNWLLVELKASIPMLDIVKNIPVVNFALEVLSASTIPKLWLLKEMAQPGDAPNRKNVSNQLDIRGNKRSTQDQLNSVQDIIKEYSTELQSWSTDHLSGDPPQNEVILLTGASGSVGTLLLDALCRSPKIQKVFTAVRGPESVKKLKSAYKSRGLNCSISFDSGKIEVFEYDMESPMLGVDSDLYHRMSTEVTTVVHNAWKLDFVADVKDFESIYLRGTINLLKFCATGNIKVFAFTSSYSTCTGKSTNGERVYESAISEDPTTCFEMGYAQSKYIVERVTQVASNALSIPIRILRLGQVSGHSKTGFWSGNDLVPIVIQTSAHIQAFPVPLVEYVDWIPSDVAAQSMCDILTTKSKDQYSVYNIINPHPIMWSRLTQMLRNGKVFSAAVKEVSLNEWIAKLEKISVGNGASFPGLRLLPVFEAVNHKGWHSNPFAIEKATEASDSLRACPEFQESWLELYIQSWRQHGYLPNLV